MGDYSPRRTVPGDHGQPQEEDGDLYHAEQTITAIKDGDGRITHFVSVLKDMTERRRMQEARSLKSEILASTVQRRLFPAASPPEAAGYDIAGAVSSQPRPRVGDYFDFVPMANDALALVAADVSGHGLGPALVMAETRAYLRSLTQATNDLLSITAAVNRFLFDDLQEDYFVTMLLAKLDPATGRLTCVTRPTPAATSSAPGKRQLRARLAVPAAVSLPGPWRATPTSSSSVLERWRSW